MTLPRYQNWVHGKPLKNHDNSFFSVINPATNEVIYEVEAADDFIQQEAIKSARQGFKEWSAYSATTRSQLLLEAVRRLRERNDELAHIEVLDTGKPWQEAVAVDINTGADAIEFFSHLAISAHGHQQTVGDDFFYTRHEPIGVCAGIGAWNYPLQIACWKAGPALAAGNAMLFKPSEETPLGALKLAEIFTEVGIPPGVFNVVLGDKLIGQWLSEHPTIDKVSFTGSVATGRAVMARAGQSLKSVTMELGGKSPLIIFEDAELDEAVSAAMLGNFYTQGEICTNGTRVFVHENIAPLFIDKLLTRIKQNIVIGDPLHPQTNFGAVISKAHQNRVLQYIATALEEGATLLCGGHACAPANAPNGYFIEPTVFTHCHDEMTIVQEEIFGPVMAMLTFSDENDVIERANNTYYGLAAGVFTQNIKRAHRVVHQLEAGICWINAFGDSPVEMPVGGYKQSGVGRENGIETFYQYTQTKSVYVGMKSIESPF